jgi:hypothetical protein
MLYTGGTGGKSLSAYQTTGLQDAPPKRPRFGEVQKFLPVAFVASTIIGLYNIYLWFHLVPLLQIDAQEDPTARNRGMWEFVVFHYFTAMLVICYIRSILEHPGEIPDHDPQWEYMQDGRSNFDWAQYSKSYSQEVKKTGERRHCKWCGKYKPDRCHHCRVCKTCILKMDHHCPWIYNCVGFANYKFFFLLLLYTVLDTHLILWTMAESVRRCFEVPSTPFATMVTLFFGWTLALFLGTLVTVFFCFHIGLMLKAMTTIEFCEKSGSRGGKDGERKYDSSVYDLGFCGNVRAVLGDNWLLWFFPCARKEGDGLHFVSDESRLTDHIESGKGIRRIKHQMTQRAQIRHDDDLYRQGNHGGSGPRYPESPVQPH